MVEAWLLLSYMGAIEKRKETKMAMNPSQLKVHINHIIDDWYSSKYINLDYDCNESLTPPDTFYCTGCHIRKDLKLLSKSNRTKNRRCITCQTLRLQRSH